MGAVKSNLGHSEGSSGRCSVAKVLVAFENKCIPANLHFEDTAIEVIDNKTIIPVMVNTPFDNGIVGVNSFGVGGVNAHALLKANDKEVTEDSFKIANTIPRIVNVCGRTEEAISHIFNFIQNNPNKVTRDFLSLLTDTMKYTTYRGSAGFPYRGYMIIKEKPSEENAIQYDYQKTIGPAGAGNAVWLVFSGMNILIKLFYLINVLILIT